MINLASKPSSFLYSVTWSSQCTTLHLFQTALERRPTILIYFSLYNRNFLTAGLLRPHSYCCNVSYCSRMSFRYFISEVPNGRPFNRSDGTVAIYSNDEVELFAQTSASLSILGDSGTVHHHLRQLLCPLLTFFSISFLPSLVLTPGRHTDSSRCPQELWFRADSLPR